MKAGWTRRNRSLNTTSRNSRAWRRAIVLCSLWGGALTTCGIPQLAYIAPPIPGIVRTLPATIDFRHDQRANDIDSFLGYELYYKFYDPGAGSLFDADRAVIEAASPGAVASTITARGYRRVERIPDEKPSVPFGATERSEENLIVTIRFQQGSPTGARAEWGTQVVDLVRNQTILNNPRPELGFREQDLAIGTHGDLPSTDFPFLGMGLAIVAYGIDYITNTFGELYSTAVVPFATVQIAY